MTVTARIDDRSELARARAITGLRQLADMLEQSPELVRGLIFSPGVSPDGLTCVIRLEACFMLAGERARIPPAQLSPARNGHCPARGGTSR